MLHFMIMFMIMNAAKKKEKETKPLASIYNYDKGITELDVLIYFFGIAIFIFTALLFICIMMR